MKVVFLLYYACEFFTFFSFFVNYDKFAKAFTNKRNFLCSGTDKYDYKENCIAFFINLW